MGSRRHRWLLIGFASFLLLPVVMFCAAYYVLHCPQAAKQAARQLSLMVRGARYLGDQGVVLQLNSYGCGPAALKMVFDHYALPSTLSELERRLGTTSAGTTMLHMREVAEQGGLRVEAWRLTPADLSRVPLPAIVLINENHYVVVVGLNSDEVAVKDPASGVLGWRKEAFFHHWKGEILIFHSPHRAE